MCVVLVPLRGFIRFIAPNGYNKCMQLWPTCKTQIPWRKFYANRVTEILWLQVSAHICSFVQAKRTCAFRQSKTLELTVISDFHLNTENHNGPMPAGIRIPMAFCLGHFNKIAIQMLKWKTANEYISFKLYSK